MATGSESEEEKNVLPKHGWRVPLNNTYSHKPQPCYIPRWSQIPKLIGLGWRFVAKVSHLSYTCLFHFLFVGLSVRDFVLTQTDASFCFPVHFPTPRFMKYAAKERKNGKVPFIDPYSTNPCRQVYGMYIKSGNKLKFRHLFDLFYWRAIWNSLVFLVILLRALYPTAKIRLLV